ncbi:MAG: RNA-binding domain-containing protein [Anaerolineae bacterium]|jgi:membrane protein YdbS with pleckstrin-like domain
MNQSEIIIRKTPFFFLKRVAALIFFFALLPAIVAALLDLRSEYQASALAGIVPNYTLFVVLLLALVQFLLVVVAFVTWYLPVYVADSRQIVRKGGGLQGDRKLADMASIGAIIPSQGPLGRRLDYGDLTVGSEAGGALAAIKDIPTPGYYAEQLSRLAELARARRAAHEPKPAAELLAAGEGQFVEFKASLLWDYYRQAVNKDLYEPVMKNLVAFMNTAGGALLIGVSDEGEVLGLERDFSGLPKKNVDGFENTFNQAFNSMIGAEWRQYVTVSFEEIDGKTVCLLTVVPASAPVYLTFKGKEDFYIRTGNSSQPLSVSQATRYIGLNFSGSSKNI